MHHSFEVKLRVARSKVEGSQAAAHVMILRLFTPKKTHYSPALDHSYVQRTHPWPQVYYSKVPPKSGRALVTAFLCGSLVSASVIGFVLVWVRGEGSPTSASRAIFFGHLVWFSCRFGSLLIQIFSSCYRSSIRIYSWRIVSWYNEAVWEWFSDSAGHSEQNYTVRGPHWINSMRMPLLSFS